MSKETVVPAVKVAGIGTLNLDTAHTSRKLGKDAAKAAGVSHAIVRRWATLTETVTEAFVPGKVTDDNPEPDDVALLLESNRYSVKVPAPMVKGAAAPLPATVTVTAFDTPARSLALAAFDTGERSDGSRKVHVYGALEYARPNGASYAMHVKVTPSADGKEWRIAAILAQ